MRLVLLYLSCWIGLCVEPLHGEILQVLVHWKGITCNATCVQMLVQRFQTAPGVAGVTVNPAAQTIALRWQPTAPFTYQSVKFPMQTVGPGIEYLSVRVRGMIRYQNNLFWLVSMGDNTPFALYGNLALQPNQMVPYYTPSTHPLSPDTQVALTQAMQQGRIVVVDGPLLLPERAPPLMLVVNSLQIVQPELHQPPS